MKDTIIMQQFMNMINRPPYEEAVVNIKGTKKVVKKVLQNGLNAIWIKDHLVVAKFKLT